MHDPHSERMSGSETRAASGLALVFAFRMLGMFMVLPVLATYGMDLAGATPALIGLTRLCPDRADASCDGDARGQALSQAPRRLGAIRRRR